MCWKACLIGLLSSLKQFLSLRFVSPLQCLLNHVNNVFEVAVDAVSKGAFIF